MADNEPSHDFDFEFGEWKTRLTRLLEPMSGSDVWVEYEGTSVVRPIWSGAASLGELEVRGNHGAIQGLSLRLYDPAAEQWRIHWASARDGVIGPAMVGGFAHGVGEFYNQELFDGRAVFVRFLFTGITPTSFRLEQASPPTAPEPGSRTGSRTSTVDGASGCVPGDRRQEDASFIGSNPSAGSATKIARDLQGLRRDSLTAANSRV